MKTKVLDRPYLIFSPYQIIQEEANLPRETTKNPEELAQYFDDIYKLYLRCLSDFEMQSTTDTEREGELTNLLTELIKTKRLLQNQN